jgi:tRNA (guanine26-N2/guanine27-N2)-dimethyltransferase
MAADRDLGVAVARALAASRPGGRTGWEMTAATGVRGLRLLKESGAFGSFLFTESNPVAFAILQENTARFPGAVARPADARTVPEDAPFDYVDLDPYGSPAPFARTALASVHGEGVLAVTATDMMVLAGAQPAACERHYGARPVRGRLGPEGGLRILLAYLSREAKTLGRSIRPILAYARDHYVRAYLTLRKGSGDAKSVGVIDPVTWDGPSVGEQGPYGPLWLGPLFDPDLVPRLTTPDGAAHPREVDRFLSTIREEVTVDRPFYFEANVLASRLGLPAPPGLRVVQEGLGQLGFRFARTHARPEGFRTDAPREAVEHLFQGLKGGGHSQKARVRA